MKNFSIKDLKRVFVVYIIISLSALSYYTFKLVTGELPSATWAVIFGVVSGLASILSLFAVFISSVQPEDITEIKTILERIEEDSAGKYFREKDKEKEIRQASRRASRVAVASAISPVFGHIYKWSRTMLIGNEEDKE